MESPAVIQALLQSQSPSEFEWVNTNGSSASSSPSSLKSSWATIASAASSDLSLSVQLECAPPSPSRACAAAVASAKHSLKFLMMPPLVRDLSDASISSTPSPSDDEEEDEEDNSSCEWVSSASSGSDDETAEWQQLSPSDAVCSSSVDSALDFSDLNSELRAAWSLQAETELAPQIIDLCSHVDGDAVEAAALAYEAELAAEAEFQASPALPPTRIDVKYECRGRNRFASNRRGLVALIDVWKKPLRDWTPRRQRASNVSFFKGSGKSGQGILQLQVAALGMNQCVAARSAANKAAAAAQEAARLEFESHKAPIYNPYDQKEKKEKPSKEKTETSKPKLVTNADGEIDERRDRGVEEAE